LLVQAFLFSLVYKKETVGKRFLPHFGYQGR